jgi:hypothetical protein
MRFSCRPAKTPVHAGKPARFPDSIPLPALHPCNYCNETLRLCNEILSAGAARCAEAIAIRRRGNYFVLTGAAGPLFLSAGDGSRPKESGICI